MALLAYRVQIDLRVGHLHPQVLQGGGHDLRIGQVAEPLVVRRNDVPGRVLGTGSGKHVLEGLRVGVPVLSLLVVVLADLPVPGGVVEPPLETFQLLFSADMQKESDDLRIALVPQQLLKIVDELIASDSLDDRNRGYSVAAGTAGTVS